MNSNGRLYDYFWIFLDDIIGKQIWTKAEWENYYEPLFKQLPMLSPYFKNTGLRVLAYEPSLKKENAFSDIKYGQLNWDEKSHRKWTISNNDIVLFTRFESWTPKWTICEKIESSPDVFLSISNERNCYSQKLVNMPFEFDTFITVAIAQEIVENCVDQVIDISKNIKANKTLYLERTWSKGPPDPNKIWSLKNSIQDVNTYGVYTKENIRRLHDCKLSEIEFEPYWKVIYVKKMA